MKRRNAVKNLGLAFTAGLAFPIIPGLLNGCRKEEPGPSIKYDGIVAVIGAGAAGLYAADILKSNGINVKIFEASDRIGGRVRSVRLFNNSPVKTDFPIELGAERILGSDSLWAEMINQFNAPLINISSNTSEGYFLDSNFKDRESVQSDTDFLNAKRFVENLVNYSGDDVSVLHAIQTEGINARVHAILNSWIGNRYGTSNSRLGIKALAEAIQLYSLTNKSELTLRSHSMQDILTSRFNAVIPSVELNTIVKTIDYTSSKIKVTGERSITGSGKETFVVEVDKVIIAVPVSILKEGSINFMPALPVLKTQALTHLAMDSCLRVVLDFKQNFWGSQLGFIYGGIEGPEYFSTGVLRSQFNKSLSVTIQGLQAEKFSSLEAESVVLMLLEELDLIFDGKASFNIRRDDAGKMAYEYFDWSKEASIKGGISYVTPGGSNEARVALSQPVSSLLFFAGEATDSKGEAGTISGALASGKRSADEVIASVLAS